MSVILNAEKASDSLRGFLSLNTAPRLCTCIPLVFPKFVCTDSSNQLLEWELEVGGGRVAGLR